LWHKDAQKSNNIKGAILGKITKWIYAYIVIFLVHKVKNPSEILETLKTLSDRRKNVMNQFSFSYHSVCPRLTSTEPSGTTFLELLERPTCRS
jgi:hypothetical protein